MVSTASVCVCVSVFDAKESALLAETTRAAGSVMEVKVRGAEEKQRELVCVCVCVCVSQRSLVKQKL